MGKPVLFIVNGLPGSGKTTLARRLAADVGLPVFSRDGMYETLYDALECHSNGLSLMIRPATFTLLYYVAGSVLAAGQPLIVEGFFGRPELRSAEFLQLQHANDFEPFQILCKTDGGVLLERFLARVGTGERHAGHPDLEWLEQNKEQLLQGRLTPLALGGQLVEIDTTTPHSFEYADLLQRVHAALRNMNREEARASLEVIILMGLQASGKSTFFRTHFALTHAHVSKDLLRNNGKKARRQQQLIEEALRAGRSVVIDNTNASREEREELIKLGHVYGATVIGYFFEVQVQKSLERNKLRQGKARVPDVAIFTTRKRLVRPSAEEGFDRLFSVRALGDETFEVSNWKERLE